MQLFYFFLSVFFAETGIIAQFVDHRRVTTIPNKRWKVRERRVPIGGVDTSTL